MYEETVKDKADDLSRGVEMLLALANGVRALLWT